MTAGLLLLFFFPLNSNHTTTEDSWICYLPAAMGFSRLRIDQIHDALGVSIFWARPPLLPLLIAPVHLLLPMLSWPQAGHLTGVMTGGFLAYAILGFVRHRGLSTGVGVATAVLALVQSAIAFGFLRTTPDTLFAGAFLLLVDAMLRERPAAICAWFAVLLVARGNGFTLLPGVLWSLRRKPAFLLGAVALFLLDGAFSEWAAPGIRLMATPAWHWHKELYLRSSWHKTLGEVLQLERPVQWYLFAKRLAYGAPRELLLSGLSQHAWLAPLLAWLGVGAGAWAIRRRTGPVLLFLSFYVAMAMFHFEARYWAALYTAGTVALAVLIARRSPRALAVLAGLAIAGGALDYRVLPFTRRVAFLDDSNYRNPKFDVAGEVYYREALVRGTPVVCYGDYNFARFAYAYDAVRCSRHELEVPR